MRGNLKKYLVHACNALSEIYLRSVMHVFLLFIFFVYDYIRTEIGSSALQNDDAKYSVVMIPISLQIWSYCNHNVENPRICILLSDANQSHSSCQLLNKGCTLNDTREFREITAMYWFETICIRERAVAMEKLHYVFINNVVLLYAKCVAPGLRICGGFICLPTTRCRSIDTFSLVYSTRI